MKARFRRFLAILTSLPVIFGTLVVQAPAQASSYTFEFYSPSATEITTQSTGSSPAQSGEKFEVEILTLNSGSVSGRTCEIASPSQSCTIGGFAAGDILELAVRIVASDNSRTAVLPNSGPQVVGKPFGPVFGAVASTLTSLSVRAISGPPSPPTPPQYAQLVVKPTHFRIVLIDSTTNTPATDSNGNPLPAEECQAQLDPQTTNQFGVQQPQTVSCSVTFNGLTAGDAWNFEAVAVVKSGAAVVESNPSAQSRAFTVGAPETPQMTATAGNSRIRVNLAPGGSQNAVSPTSYSLTYSVPGPQPQPVTVQCNVLDGAGACSLELTGLNNFATHNLTAFAVNSFGQSSDPARASATPTLEVFSDDLVCGNGASNDAIYLFHDQALKMNLKAADNCGGFTLDSSNAGSDWKELQSGGAFSAPMGPGGPMPDPSATIYLLSAASSLASSSNQTTRIFFSATTSVQGDLNYSWVNDGNGDAEFTVDWNFTDPVAMPEKGPLVLILVLGPGYDQPSFPRCQIVKIGDSCVMTGVDLTKVPFSDNSVNINITEPDESVPALPSREFFVDVFWTPHLLSSSRLDVKSTGNGEVELEWDAPLESGAGSGLKEYELTYTLSGGSPATQTCAGNTLSTNGNTVVESCTVTGLTVDGEYDFELRTVDTVDRKSATPATITAFAIAPPGAPTITSATRGDESVTLSVTANTASGVGIPSDYLITATPTSGGVTVGPVTCAYANTSTSCAMTGLTNGTEYSFTAEAINNSASSGSGFVSSAANATPAATPGLISGLTATPGNSQMALNWSAPASDGGDSITDYKVEYKASSGGTWTLFNDGTSPTTSATVTGLTNGASYDFRVSATNSVGDGPTAAITSTPVTTPGAISGLTSTAGNAQVSLSWSAPSNTGGSPITDYKVEYSTDGNTWNVFSDGVSDSTGATVTGLTNGTAYTLRVSAINAVGTALTPVSISATPATLPGAIFGLSATPGNNQVTLSWNAPTTGGSAITDYRVEYQASSGGTWTLFSDGTSSSTSATVTGLTNGTAYDFRVFAINGVGTQTAPSNIASATPAVPVGPPGTPSLTNVVSGDGKLTVDVIEGTGSTPTSYDISATPVGGGTTIGPVNCLHAGDPTSCEVTGLSNGVSYTLTAVAKNGSGDSAVTPVQTSPVAPVALPGVPSVVAINGDGQATLNITAGTPGGAPTAYEISSSPPVTGGIPDCNVTVNVNPTACVVTGLTNGTAYTFTATAKNSSGQSANPSGASNSVSPIALPGTPAISTVVAGNAKATVTVTAPLSGGAADDYEVSVVGDPTKKCTISATASPLSCEITGLTNGADYQFEATASNSAGSSTASAAVAPASAVPLTPTVSASSGNTQATLTLTPGSIGEVTSFDVDVIAGGATVRTVNCPATAGTTPTSCVVTGLTNGTSYTFAAVANNAAGSSVSASSPSNAVSPAAPPPPSSNNTTVAPTVPTAPGITQTPAPAVNTNLVPTGNQNAVASVGGQLQPVTVTPAPPVACQQSTSCQVPSGAISNGTTVSVGSTQLTVSGPALGGSGGSGVTIVMPGQPVNISANGFEPNSQAALFALPLGSALASLTVGSDGLLVAAPELDELLPANTTAIQITGNTANGPIALSIKILVAVAPEPARTNQQLLPQTNSGSAIVLVDGGASQYQPRRFEQRLVVDAEGTSLAIGVLEDTEPAPLLETGDLSARKNQWLNLTGSGYSEYVDVFLFSEPRFLGRVLVGQDGSFIGSLQIPNNVTAGWHTLQTVGKNGDGLEIAASFAIEIRQAEPPRFWTKAVDKEVKLYGLHVVGAGKVQFFQNGKEVAWIRADNDADPKLRVLKSGTLAGRDYFVRTRVPVAGKNVFEIYLNGERVLRRIFTLRG